MERIMLLSIMMLQLHRLRRRKFQLPDLSIEIKFGDKKYGLPFLKKNDVTKKGINCQKPTERIITWSNFLFHFCIAHKVRVVETYR